MLLWKGSNFSLYQRMWSAMESTEPSVFVKDNKEGEERVAKSKRLYAFFMESLSLEYIIERNCNLTQIGGLLDSKGYGIAMAVSMYFSTTKLIEYPHPSWCLCTRFWPLFKWMGVLRPIRSLALCEPENSSTVRSAL